MRQGAPQGFHQQVVGRRRKRHQDLDVEITWRHPRGFKSVQVLATTLDPRTKFLYGISVGQHADVWNLVQTEAVKIALQTRQERTSGVGVSQPSQAAAGAKAAGRGASSRKRARSGGFMTAAQSAGRASTQQQTDSGVNGTKRPLSSSTRRGLR